MPLALEKLKKNTLSRYYSMSKIILYIVPIGLILLIGCAIWPYWNKYCMNLDLKAAAIYGTKHNIEDTQRFLGEKIKERGYVFDPSKLQIEKDGNKTVSICFTYQDETSFFGIVLKEHEFTLDVTEHYVKEYA